jgi:DNA-directed RNA polymerase subunit RPC12/RpoP
MLVTVREETDEIARERIEETDDMKVKCTLCVLRTGAAPKTDNVYLVTLKGRDYFACPRCRDEIIPMEVQTDGKQVEASSDRSL